MRAGLSARMEATANIRECRERFQASRIERIITQAPFFALNPARAAAIVYIERSPPGDILDLQLTLLLCLGAALLNLPFGYYRAGDRKFSIQCFLAIHLPVPLIFIIRITSCLLHI